MAALKRHICLWVLPSPILTSRQTSDLAVRRSPQQRFAKLASTYNRGVTWTCINGGDEGSGKEEKDDKKDDNRDWDSSWSDFSEKRKGGVFGLGEESTPQQRQKVDERTDRLTSAWSNDVGFLVGIGVIALIAAFYVYIYVTGGI